MLEPGKHLAQPLVEVPLSIIGFIGIIWLLTFWESFLIPLFFAVFFSYILRGLARGLDHGAVVTCRYLRRCLGTVREMSSGQRRTQQRSQQDEESQPILEVSHLSGDIGQNHTADEDDEKKAGEEQEPLLNGHYQREEAEEDEGPPPSSWRLFFLMIIVLGIIVFIVWFVANNVVKSAQEWKDKLEHNQDYSNRAKALESKLGEWEQDVSNFLGLNSSHTDVAGMVWDYAKKNTLAHPMDVASRMSQGIIGLVLWFSFVVCLLPVTLVQSHSPSSEQGSPQRLRYELDKCIGEYILRKSAISFLGAFLMWILLASFGVPLSFIIAFLSFFLNFIPEFGFFIFTFCLLLSVLLDPYSTPLLRLLAILLPTVLNFLIGRLEAFIYSDELHPVIVLLSLVFWQKIWDVPGMMLAVPITSVVKICLSHINHPYTRFLSQVLAGSFENGKTAHDSGKYPQ